MLTPWMTVTLPLLGRLVIVTEVASALQFRSQERSLARSDSTPDCAGRVNLISWASAPVPMCKAASKAIAGVSVRMTLPAHIWTMTIPSSAVRRSAVASKLR
jgi:hypothetical protein